MFIVYYHVLNHCEIVMFTSLCQTVFHAGITWLWLVFDGLELDHWTHITLENPRNFGNFGFEFLWTQSERLVKTLMDNIESLGCLVISLWNSRFTYRNVRCNGNVHNSTLDGLIVLQCCCHVRIQVRIPSSYLHTLCQILHVLCMHMVFEWCQYLRHQHNLKRWEEHHFKCLSPNTSCPSQFIWHTIKWERLM